MMSIYLMRRTGGLCRFQVKKSLFCFGNFNFAAEYVGIGIGSFSAVGFVIGRDGKDLRVNAGEDTGIGNNFVSAGGKSNVYPFLTFALNVALDTGNILNSFDHSKGIIPRFGQFYTWFVVFTDASLLPALKAGKKGKCYRNKKTTAWKAMKLSAR